MDKIEQRGYQQEALEAVIKEHKSGTHRQLISSPTGTGKTVMIALIVKHHNKRTLIISHREELIRQTVKTIKKCLPKADLGIVKAERKEYNHQIVVGSVQSCKSKKRLKALKEQDFEILIVDEAHHVATSSYQKIVKALGFMDNSSRKLLLGFTSYAL